MFLYVLETKVSHHVSENTLLVRSGEEERKTTQNKSRRNKRASAAALCRILPRGDNSLAAEGCHCALAQRAPSARWAEMQIPLLPLIRIFKFSNIYAATIEWQLTSLIFIEEIRKPWAAVNLAGPWPPRAWGGGAANNPFIQTFGLKE